MRARARLTRCALAGAEVGAPAVEDVGEAEQVAEPGQLALGGLGRDRVQVGEEQKQLADGQPLVQPGPGRDQADAAFDLVRVAGRAEPGDRRLAARRPEQPEQHAERRRLAGAVGAEQAVNLARLTANETSSTASRLPPPGRGKRLVRCSTSIMVRRRGPG